MSFEGFYQALCTAGHHSIFDAYEAVNPTDKEWVCPICGKPCAWWNLVDTTNPHDDGSYDGSVELEEDEPPTLCTCKDCGNKHIARNETYLIPKDKGHLI